jgi:hypothetical protein
VGAGAVGGGEVNGWAWLLVGWFALNAVLHVAFIGESMIYTVRTALISLCVIYPSLIYVVTRAVG